MIAKRWRSTLCVAAAGAGIAVVAILVGYPFFVVLPLVGIVVFGSITQASLRATERPIAADSQAGDSARAANVVYELRVEEATRSAEARTAWMNVADAVIGSMSAMESGYPTAGATLPFVPKDRVEIVHRPSGTVVADMRMRRDDALGVAALITRDLDELDARSFETEWNVKPPDESSA
jgi:hypothetical protein